MTTADSPRAKPWQLWLATPAAAGHFDPAAQSFEDKRRWSRMPADGRRIDWATSRALLARVAPVDLTRSLSHSGSFAALALAPADVRIGLDVEQTNERRDCLRLARFAFAPEEADEMAVLGESARRDRFYTLWTLKEACIKALGLRLLDGLRRCIFTRENGRWAANVPTIAFWEARVYRPRSALYLALMSLPVAPSWTQHEWPDAAAAEWPLIAAMSSGATSSTQRS